MVESVGRAQVLHSTAYASQHSFLRNKFFIFQKATIALFFQESSRVARVAWRLELFVARFSFEWVFLGLR